MSSASSPSLTVYVQNIACSVRDEQPQGLSLWDRLEPLMENIRQVNPDVAILLEAGRSSQGHSWLEMACLLEKGTGLTLVGLLHANGSVNPFAHAIFVNRKTARLASCVNIPVPVPPEGPGFDCSLGLSTFNPVVEGKVCYHFQVKVCSVHMPMGARDRMRITQWLADNYAQADMLLGDFNTFPDDMGPEMLAILKQAGLRHLPCNLDYTFQAFPNDQLQVPVEKRQSLHPLAEIVAETEAHLTVRMVSILDHIFLNPGEGRHRMEGHFCPLTEASDHCAMTVRVSF